MAGTARGAREAAGAQYNQRVQRPRLRREQRQAIQRTELVHLRNRLTTLLFAAGLLVIACAAPAASRVNPTAAAPSPPAARTSVPATSDPASPVPLAAASPVASPETTPAALANPLLAIATLVPAAPAIGNILSGATPVPTTPAPTSTPFATPLPGTGAPSPDQAIRWAYQAVAANDEQSLRLVTDPEVRGNPLPVFEMLGRGDRKLMLTNMEYTVIEDDGRRAIIRVTGTVGNIPLLGERSIDVLEVAKLIGSSWYLTRPTDGSAPRR